ncbi:salicylic acid-binding protein 2-like [Alnus glutinosa]|uniref:salicylic acid-binding protein 2-like n=1 Tax=Alnus glutinosa TaxID=3517 RepID=UPI002D7857AD|nr:salicylic acid-binding protein 2-like [Alnus glutinosa]
MAASREQTHFVLVHGLCLGAWCWHKLKPRLEATGHRVTVLDLAASGINMKAIQDVHTFYDYTRPLLNLLASLAPNEKVVLVGHSLGGVNLALAMDEYPEKVAVGVFLTALMPDTTHKPSYVLDKYVEGTPAENWLDTQFSSVGSANHPLTSVLFGPNFLSSMLYQLSPIEDLELAKTLVRPGSLFREDLSKAKNFSKKGYGSVQRVYVVCDDDLAIPKEFQKWMIENSGLKDVMEIKGADHMAMVSKPQELYHRLLEIAHKYA